MDGEERKRKFTEAIVNILYPPPPEPDPEDPDPNLEPADAFVKEFGSFDVISDTLDDNENSSESGDEQLGPETEKLTRAQRKKLRRKKLKEEATRRGKLIGPLLPMSSGNHDHCGDQVSPAVRSNASEEDSAAVDSGTKPACYNTRKIKHRRKARKLAKEKLNSTSNSQNCNRTATSSSGIDPKEAR